MTAADKKEVTKIIKEITPTMLQEIVDEAVTNAVTQAKAEIRVELQEATGRVYGHMVCTSCRDELPKRYKDALAPSRARCKKCGGEMKWEKAG